MTLDEFFAGRPGSRAIFDALRAAVDALGNASVGVSKSQARGAPLVLTLGFRARDPSPRWKEIVEPAPGRFTHHLELWSADDIDDEVVEWLRRARSDAE